MSRSIASTTGPGSVPGFGISGFGISYFSGGTAAFAVAHRKRNIWSDRFTTGAQGCRAYRNRNTETCTVGAQTLES